jgi:hypothetical protein
MRHRQLLVEEGRGTGIMTAEMSIGVSGLMIVLLW